MRNCVPPPSEQHVRSVLFRPFAVAAVAAMLATSCSSGSPAPDAAAAADTAARPATAEPSPDPTETAEPFSEQAAHTDWPMTDLVADLGDDGWRRGWQDAVWSVRSYVTGETSEADDGIAFGTDADYTAHLELGRTVWDEIGYAGRVSTAWFPEGHAEVLWDDEPPVASGSRAVTVSRSDVSRLEQQAVEDRVREAAPELDAAYRAEVDAINEQRVADGKEAFLGWSDPDEVESVPAPEVGLPEADVVHHAHSSGLHEVTVGFRIAPYDFDLTVRADDADTAEAGAVELARRQYDHAAALLAGPFAAATMTVDPGLFTDVDSTIPDTRGWWWWRDRYDSREALLDASDASPGSLWARELEAAGVGRSVEFWFADEEDWEAATTRGWLKVLEADEPGRLVDGMLASGRSLRDAAALKDVSVPSPWDGVALHGWTGRYPDSDLPHTVAVAFVLGDAAVEVKASSSGSVVTAEMFARRLVDSLRDHVSAPAP